MMLNMSESTIPEPEVKWIDIRTPMFFWGPISQGAAAQAPLVIFDCLIGCVMSAPWDEASSIGWSRIRNFETEALQQNQTKPS